MVMTIQKHLMVNRTQSDIIYRNATSFQGSMIVSRLASFCIVSLKYAGELAGLLFQFVLGIIANTLSALTLRKIPSRSVVDYQSGESIFTILVRALREPNSRRILYTRWISFGKLILFGMFIPFIRISSGHSAAAIFLLAMVINIASFLSSLSLRPLANMVGNRPVQFYSAVLSSICFLIISFIATDYSLAVYLILSFLTMFFLNASMLTANRFILLITPDSGAVQFNSMDTFVVSCVALVLGVGGGMLVDISSFIFPEGPINNYGLVFLLGSLISICQLFLTIRIQEPRSLSLRQSIRMLLNIGNFRIWQTINNLESTVNPVKRKVLIRSIGRSRASLASAEIKKIMMEPVSSEKGELIETLFITKRPELLEYLLNEATDTQAFHREKAVFTLGAYPDERTRQVLVDLLDDPSARIRSSAAKSLGRIGCKDQYEKVSALWLKADSLLELLDYMIALYSMDEKKHYITDVFSRIITNCPEGMQRDILTLLSMQFGMSPTLSAIYREESFQYGSGMAMLLEESRDTGFMLENGNSLMRFWQDSNFPGIWKCCLTGLVPADDSAEHMSLREALSSFPVEKANSSNALAVTYFTYQILTSKVK